MGQLDNAERRHDWTVLVAGAILPKPTILPAFSLYFCLLPHDSVNRQKGHVTINSPSYIVLPTTILSL